MFDVDKFIGGRKSSEEEEQRKMLSQAFHDVRSMFAFKHLMGYMDELHTDAMRKVDEISIRELTIQEIAEARGVRKCVDLIKAEVDLHLHGGPV